MTYILVYSSIGVVALAVILAQNYLSKKRGESFDFGSVMRENYSPARKFLEDLVLPVIVGLLVIAVWPVALGFMAKHTLSNALKKKRRAAQAFRIKTEDLVTQLSIEEVENLEGVTDPLGAAPNLPFGHLYPTWERFKDELSPDDELWSFATVWEGNGGDPQKIAGYVAVKNGGIGEDFITLRRTLDEEDVVPSPKREEQSR